jgi:hypothetical protein
MIGVGCNMDYTIKDIKMSRGREYIMERHYTGGCAVASMTWGLFDSDDEMVGAIAFHTPISENVRKAVWGDDVCWCDDIEGEHGFHEHITELHRLVTVDDIDPTATSWFISQALDRLKEYKPKYWGVLSFADSTEDHDGTVYQATNAIYTGMTGESVYYRDQDGVLRPPRNGGHNISKEEAHERGWEVEKRKAKHRYLFLLPNGQRHRRWMLNNLKFEQREYPSVNEEPQTVSAD